MIEEAVNKDAGDRDVIPDWKGPACPGTVFLAFIFDCQSECYQNKRNNKYCENNMAHQHDVIEFEPEAFSGKGRVYALYQIFVQYIEKQKDNGCAKYYPSILFGF